jgi:dephospho-CoA kinase
MKLLGLIGGVASGKSTVAELFRQQGAVVLDADRVGHEVLRLPGVRAVVGGRWGKEVIGSDGEIDRKALGRIVFGPPPDGPRELAELERITHLEIRRRLAAEIEKLAKTGTRLAILDAAVMLKSGWDRLCDTIAFIDVPRELRLARALSRGWTAEDFARREAAQEPVDEKRRRANIVLDNSRDLGYIQSQVQHCWQTLAAS